MMKTGILTYHNTRNCGAALQAYALQQALFVLGVDNEIIDYRCGKIEDTYKIKHFWEMKSPKMLIKWALTIRYNKKAEKKFELFRNKEFKLSPPYTRDTIAEANSCFDGFITGSDQVWNFYLNGGDYAYLLDFAGSEKKKISYAASMGSADVSDNDSEALKKALTSFSLISVREKTLKEYLKKQLGIESELVLDPTLLLKKENYSFDDANKPEGKYIFVYTIAPTPNIEKTAKALSDRTGYPVIWGHMSYRKKTGFKNVTDLSPAEFVNYIKNAEYVLTSSFHGMAFSIILEKQFFYDLDISVKNNNARLETLSALLGLKSRELTADIEGIYDKADIDYSSVNQRLEEERNRSVDFLKKAVLGEV